MNKICGNPSEQTTLQWCAKTKQGNIKAVAIQIHRWKKGGTEVISQLTDVIVGPLSVENELKLGNFNDNKSKCANVKFTINFLKFNSI